MTEIVPAIDHTEIMVPLKEGKNALVQMIFYKTQRYHFNTFLYIHRLSGMKNVTDKFTIILF